MLLSWQDQIWRLAGHISKPILGQSQIFQNFEDDLVWEFQTSTINGPPCRLPPLLPLGRLANHLDTKFIWENGEALMQCRDKGQWRTMTKFEIRNNMANEKAARMTSYLNHGVKAKMREATPFVNSVALCGIAMYCCKSSN